MTVRVRQEKVEIDLAPVIATLEGLVDDFEKSSQCNIVHHGLIVPRDFPVDFIDAAAAAVRYAQNLSIDHTHSKIPKFPIN